MVYFILESQVIAYDRGCQSRNPRQELKQILGGMVFTGFLPLPAKLTLLYNRDPPAQEWHCPEWTGPRQVTR